MCEDETSVPIACTVNGKPVTATVPDRLSLADFLRNRLGLTGTHLGCEHGVCGACTVLLDGVSVRSCLLFAAQADGHSVTTVEGLTDADRNADLCRALSDEHGLQCGFCTPGFLATAVEMLAEDTPLTEDLVREGLSGNVCRCTGYTGIVRAVLRTAQARRSR